MLVDDSPEQIVVVLTVDDADLVEFSMVHAVEFGVAELA